MNTRIQRFLLPGLLSLFALGACGGAEDADAAPANGAQGGGKADDADGVCESADCLESYDACLNSVADPEECGAGFALCLAVNEGAALVDCGSLDADAAGVCETCNDVPECDVVEDGADANACAGATAVCQFESVGLLPAGCSLPEAEATDPCASRGCTELYTECLAGDSIDNCQRAHAACLATEATFEYGTCDLLPDSDLADDQCLACAATEACAEAEQGGDYDACAVSEAECLYDAFDVLPGLCDPPEVQLFDPCLSMTCRTQLDECLETIDRDGCTREYAACLAVEETFELSTCDVLPDEARETCELCEGVDACASVEDGSDANACAAAVAQCHWDTLAVLPSACTPPPELD